MRWFAEMCIKEIRSLQFEIEDVYRQQLCDPTVMETTIQTLKVI